MRKHVEDINVALMRIQIQKPHFSTIFYMKILIISVW